MGGGPAVVILAGGASRRFGPDKPLQRVGQRSMLAQVIMTALATSEEVIVVTGNPLQEARYRQEIPPSVALVHDKVSQKGPLIALYTGLENIRSEYAVVLPSDCPFVKKEVILYLLRVADGRDAAIPVWPDGKIEPLHCVFRVEPARRAITEALKAEMDTIREMIQQLDRVELVPIKKIKELDPHLVSLLNINTREDLERARKIWIELAPTEQISPATDRR